MHYPSLRDNIIYFDDTSTDGTREELEKREIRVVTWSSESAFERDKMLNSLKIINNVGYISARVSFIISEIINNTTTDKLLILDGDTVTLSDKLLGDYYKELEFSNIVSLITYNGALELEIANKDFDSIKPMHEYYQRFRYFDKDSNEVFYPRIHFLTTFLNLTSLKSKNIRGDRLEYSYLECMNGYIVDTGTDLYHQLMDNNIKPLRINDISKYIYHWTWVSSSTRVSESSSTDMFSQSIQNILSECNSDKLKCILDKVNITPLQLTRQLRLTQNKSKLI